MTVYSYTDAGGERLTIERSTGDAAGFLLMIDGADATNDEQRGVFITPVIAAIIGATLTTEAIHANEQDRATINRRGDLSRRSR